MNVLIKNCKVEILTGTETLAISGKTNCCGEGNAPAVNSAGVIGENRVYTVAGFMANRDKVRIGDRVKLPAFIVPAAKMDGKKVMDFDELHIKADEAIVVGTDEKENFILVFDHCLFQSAVDLNDEKRFEMTQLGQYLQSEFLRAMNGAGIPAESCGLISNDEMFGDNRLEYFKNGRNRVAFDFDDDCSVWYWLSTPYESDIASGARFCNARGNGYSSCDVASSANGVVRPRFVIRSI